MRFTRSATGTVSCLVVFFGKCRSSCYGVVLCKPPRTVCLFSHPPRFIRLRHSYDEEHQRENGGDDGSSGGVKYGDGLSSGGGDQGSTGGGGGGGGTMPPPITREYVLRWEL